MKEVLLNIGNAISKQVIKIPKQIRIVVIYACIAVLNISCYAYLLDDYTHTFLVPSMINAGLGTLVFAVLILIGMDKEYTEEVFDKRWILSLFLCICGIMIVISGFLHDIGYSYIAMGLFMSIMMPVYCLVWGDKEHLDRMFLAVASVTIVLFVTFFILQIIVTPREAGEFFLLGRYRGMCGNPNGLAKVAITAFLSALYLFGISKQKEKYFYAIVMGMSLSMVLMSGSRANFLSLCVLTLFFVVIKYKNAVIEKKNIKELMFSCIIVIAIAGLMVPVSKYALEWKTNNLIEDTNVDVDKDVGVIDRTSQGISANSTVDVESISGGRISIWMDVISNSKFMGRDKDDIVFNSHNAIIEYLKRSGWIAAISFFLVELGSAIWILITVFSKKKVDDYQMFAVMGITAYGIVSLLDIVDLPFAKFITTIFYLCFAAMCVKTKSTKS